LYSIFEWSIGGSGSMYFDFTGAIGLPSASYSISRSSSSAAEINVVKNCFLFFFYSR